MRQWNRGFSTGFMNQYPSNYPTKFCYLRPCPHGRTGLTGIIFCVKYLSLFITTTTRLGRYHQALATLPVACSCAHGFKLLTTTHTKSHRYVFVHNPIIKQFKINKYEQVTQTRNPAPRSANVTKGYHSLGRWTQHQCALVTSHRYRSILRWDNC